MPVVSTFKLSQLDGLLNRRLGDLQNSRVSRQLLKRSPDLVTYTSTRYQNWNLTQGVTIFVNKQPLLSEDIKYQMTPARETLTVFDGNGSPQSRVIAVNADGKIVFAKPRGVDDTVEAEFSFRMVPQVELHALLFAGFLDVQRRVYLSFDTNLIPAAAVDIIVTAALAKFYEGMNSESSLLYNYKVQDQMHEKSQVAENMRATLRDLELKLAKDAKAVIWQLSNGRARSVRSLKRRYESSADLGGYNGTRQDGV
jgi:hypothetical protein